jgi:peptidoglycan/LPS O-acetylase OafA/YrhL
MAEHFCLATEEMYFGCVVSAFCLFMLSVKFPDRYVCQTLAVIGERYSADLYIYHVLILSVLNAAASLAGIYSATWYIWTRPVPVIACTIAVSVVLQWLGQLSKRIDKGLRL